ncbi:MAG: hypothetical protein GPJ54_05000, partial [Candidatus Heimdallarchaeota archaeon]|nr:hypothetical protein [Candidatus Heimdallarchaeota archaeon]
MSEECKALEKKAKGIEKENPTEAIDLYKQASECFGHDDNLKNKNSNLEKAAKLIRGLGKSTEDPTEALDHYEDSSSIYTEIGKEGDAEKVMEEAYQKFIVAAKSISSEARKMDIADAAEQQFKLAAGYAALAGDGKLSNKCWIESADQFYNDAKEVENPREAFEVFKHAILNYKKGKADEKFDLLLTNAADKFTKRGSEILKTKKTLALAIDNFLQAENIYRFINSDQKSQESDLKIQEICERIGMAKDSIIQYLESQGITSVSFSDLPLPSRQPDKEDLPVPITDVEPVVTDVIEDQDPLPSLPEEIPEVEEKTEPKISTPEISLPIPKLVTDDVEVTIEVDPIIEAEPIVETEP